MFKTDMAYESWEKNYKYRDETPMGTFERVARALASVEKDKDKWFSKFMTTMVKFKDGKAAGLKCLPGGRINANAGTDYKGATLLNCFSGDTEYLDLNKGLVRFCDMVDSETIVMTKNGTKKAEIKCFGRQKLYEFIFKPAHYSETWHDKTTGRLVVKDSINAFKKSRYIDKRKSSYSISIHATKDHRWLLEGGSDTIDLKIGDIVESNIVLSGVNSKLYKDGFVHGLIMGDGSVSYEYTNAVNSSGRYGKTRYCVRLCGAKYIYSSFFDEDNIKYHPSCNGEPTCYIISDKNLKEVPDIFDTDYIKGFVDGLVATDGCMTYGEKLIYEISTSLDSTANWLKKYAFVAGYIVTGFRVDSNMETQYGVRKYPNKRITLSKEDIKWRVVGIIEKDVEDVFCAIVPDEHSFTLEYGVYTGNCFVNGGVSDATISYKRKSIDGTIEYPVKIKSSETPDDLVNIFLTILEQAKTLASEGGYGLNFSFIRPRGSLIKGIGIKHPGVIAYMEVWDAVAECIVKGTSDGYYDKIKNYLGEEVTTAVVHAVKKMARKGAMMGSLNVNHPDIEEFIRAKQVSGKLTKFNMSIAIDDDFMMAVAKDDFYDLHFGGKVFKRIKAKDLYDLIMESTYNRGEPGVIFVDNMQKNNPMEYLGRLDCTNPSLRKGTRILTQDGIFEINELEGKVFKVQNLHGEWKEAECFLSGKEKQLLKIDFQQGNSVFATEEHKWPILAVKGGWAKQESKNLKKGNIIPFLNGNVNFIDFDCEFGRDIGFMVGWLYGDGWIHIENGRHEYGFFFNKNEKDIADKIIDTVNKLKPTISNVNTDDEGNFVFQISSEYFHKLMQKIGVAEKSKGIPRYIWKSNIQFIKGFLDGIISSDGSIPKNADDRKIIIVTSRENMAKDLVDIMGFIGVKSNYTTKIQVKNSWPNGKKYDKKYTRHDVFIYGTNILDFNEFYLTHKEKNKRFMEMKKNVLESRRQDFGRNYITNLSTTDIKEDVWDIRVNDDTHCFRISSGITGNCGEVGGLSSLTSVCLLGSVNVTQYINEHRKFNWKEYEEDVAVFTRLLDNVIDICGNTLPSYDWAMRNMRQIGMGINGLGSAMVMLGIAYNSKEAVSFTKKLCDIKENITMQSSALLAAEKGVCDVYDKHKFESTQYFKSDRLWKETKDLLKKHGVRNAKTTTNPPLGNGSITCDNVSNGIEPIFHLDYERKIGIQVWPEGLTAENVKKVLKEHKKKDFVYWQGKYDGKEYYYEPHNRGLCAVVLVRDYGYQWLLDNFPNDDHSEYLVTTKKLNIEAHLAIQEVVQYHLNQSVSKTCNLPSKYPMEEFKKLYFDAWKRGLNGFTTYLDGSMESVLDHVSEKNRDIIKNDIKLPDEFINGTTRIITREGMKFYIHFSYLPDDADKAFPVVIWIYTNKAKGEAVACNRASKELYNLAIGVGIDTKICDATMEKAKDEVPHNKLGRMISLCLRHNIPLNKIHQSLVVDGDSISSLLTAVRKFISEKIPNGTKAGIKCKSCGGDSVVFQSGCYNCLDCGWTGC